MRLPEYFKSVPVLTMYDPLAECLGAAEDGIIDYRYEDAVRLAGHSCPTVAMSYALTYKGLAALYGEALPERGAVRAVFGDGVEAGVTGVIASIVGLLCGAAVAGGFGGIAGRFSRRGLMQFGVGGEAVFCLQRPDTGAEVSLSARLERVPAATGLRPLMHLVGAGTASRVERQEFARLWQERVRRILLDHWQDPELWQVERRGIQA
ncbi:MAG: hypothetical protein KF909_13750 [Rhodocyclaceae bacterium]|nr:hypothetical protein [Thauera sp.]MBX3687199.1 hypothetical protein [Rhodocyclaceae bacterium]MCP5241685.1 hypothetical protein [Zoogloeaceae bacterium]MCB1913318.1 hypothetical protein [Rhodocyclaceae bacterium]MCP5255040.1 hypothetical protein [Zoogloeaceae bacterium]